MSDDAVLNLAAFALQVCLIAAAGAALLHGVRMAAAGARYACWRVVLATCLVMPLLLQRPAVPDGDVGRPAPAAVSPQASTASIPVTGLSAPVAAVPNDPGNLPWGWIVGTSIALGVMARGAWLSAGLVRLRRLRRYGVPVDASAYAELQQNLGTQATLLCVDGLTQPATFGLWRPVVLLPATLMGAADGLRRAVVTHELLHVQRRDWLWVLLEESLRTLFWFHPVIGWITSRVQLAREELVDELTVLATGDRRVYIEALLSCADAGAVPPAPAFARRRHLFTRIVRLSKEGVMSSSRTVSMTAGVIVAILASGWFASRAFPILAAAPVTPTADSPAPAAETGSSLNRAAAVPPSVPASPVTPAAPSASTSGVGPAARQQGTQVVADRQGPRGGGALRPGPAPVPAPPAGTKPITPENPIPRRLSSAAASYPAQLSGSGYRAAVTLRVTLDASGAIADVQRLSVEVVGDSAAIDRATASAAFFDAAASAVRRWRYQSPADPPIAFFVTTRFDGERDAVAVQGETPGPPIPFVTNGLLARDAALMAERLQKLRDQTEQIAAQLSVQHPDVMKGRAQVAELTRELERLREADARVRLQQGAAPQPAPPVRAPDARVAGPGATAGQPVRVGGSLRPPTKTRHVDPVYPELAKTARVQGVVIVETTIDEQGRVAEVRVLRSIPLLDQAAIDAVRQWEFTPTLLNGVPVPIIMTMTVQFTLPPPPAQ